MASLNEIRATFLNYFNENGHEVVASGPLVPRNDPTLLFTNAGMVPFKNLFTGVEKRDYTRAVSSQKCVRAGGKHNDLDNVGYTARHHTFFEMLGNFSFGDYFKEQAIPLAWNLLTKDFGLDKNKLLITIYHDDDQAADLWKKVAGLPDDRIIRIATSDNFWSMGATGPCGPCSEVFYDHGEGIPGGPPGSPDEDGDRFIEIWNLVFMQFEQFEDGTRENLPKPSIDTGMGLERVGAVLQGKHDNYDTDLMRSLIEASANLTDGAPDGPGRFHHRVIADHIRSTAFLIADGVTPSNEGRGYVLRRIMRRAMRHINQLGAHDPVMWRLTDALTRRMGQAFPELNHAKDLIEETLKLEEVRFRKTLDRGLRLLDDELERLPDGGALPGEVAFKLYDTYGFPLDLTQDALREKGRAVDIAGFDAAMSEQKAKARAAWSGSGASAESAIWFDLRETHGATEFLGYGSDSAEGVILALAQDGALCDGASEGQAVEIVVNQTPFYAESGGQQADHGVIEGPSGRVRITDTHKRAGDLWSHIGVVESGRIAPGEAVKMTIDSDRRALLQANHSATHLLNEALRSVVGSSVAQRGSLVAPERLRFDFTHQTAVNDEEIDRVEAEINAYIRQNDHVATRVMALDDAQGMGAQALFGDKYGDEVRVVSMGRRPDGEPGPAGDVYSLELCGGTHVDRLGEIGLFKILSESAASAGVRRIEAVTGEEALAHVRAQEAIVKQASTALKSNAREVVDRIKLLLEERKKLQGEMADLRKQLAMTGDGTEPEQVGAIKLTAQAIKGVAGKDLRALVDEHKKRLGSGVVALVSDVGGKAAVAVGVTSDLTDRISAVAIAQTMTPILGGQGGGGRPDMAAAGAPSAANAAAALQAARDMLKAVQS